MRLSNRFTQANQWIFSGDFLNNTWLAVMLWFGLSVISINTSSESHIYIIAIPMVCVWYLTQPPTKWYNVLFVFALLLTSFSYSDIFTPYVRTHIVRPFSLKALPCFVIWLLISVELYTKQFLKVALDRERIKKSLNNAV